MQIPNVVANKIAPCQSMVYGEGRSQFQRLRSTDGWVVDVPPSLAATHLNNIHLTCVTLVRHFKNSKMQFF